MEGMRIARVAGNYPTATSTVEAFCIPCYKAAFPYPPLDELRRRRIDRMLSQRTVAIACGTLPSVISGIEIGRDYPDPETIARMEALYDATPKRGRR